MRFRRNSLAQDSARIPPAGRVGGPTGLTRWAPAAGVAVAVVLALIGVVVISVFQGSGAPSKTASSAESGEATANAAAGLAGSGGASQPARSSKSARSSGSSGPSSPRRSAPSKATKAPRSSRQSTSKAASGRAGTAAKDRTAALRTSCRSVAHIGDSTSVDLISPYYLPDPAQRLAARYADVGVRSLRVDASGGRSIVEALPGQVNGYNVARAWRAQGYRGCWVIALGTNDTADVSVGSAVGLTGRINEMMSVAHGEPVMWVNTRTELSGGPWSEANEHAWDSALHQALARYPNMRIFDWAAVAQPAWFLSDGIHYNSVGCAARARAIANALARAFPRHGRSHRQVVM